MCIRDSCSFLGLSQAFNQLSLNLYDFGVGLSHLLVVLCSHGSGLGRFPVRLIGSLLGLSLIHI